MLPPFLANCILTLQLKFSWDVQIEMKYWFAVMAACRS